MPAGEFIMGSSDEQVDYAYALCTSYSECQRAWYEDEQPQHTVNLDSYWIMQTEVTNAQYRKFMEAGGYTTQAYWRLEGWDWRGARTVPSCWNDPNYNGPQQPVVCISWYEATAYASWLSAETGLEFALPTEAQWEKAARGSDGRQFPWGNQWNGTLANFCDTNCTRDWADQETNDGYQYAAPIGRYPENNSLYGALDMAGNVWEWTADWYTQDYYQNSSNRNLVRPVDGANRVLRGGSWRSGPSDLRAAFRLGSLPIDGDVNVGFRLRLSSSRD